MKPAKIPRRRWCNACQAEREHWHIHGDPVEKLDWAGLLQLVRVLRESEAQADQPKAEADSEIPGRPPC